MFFDKILSPDKKEQRVIENIREHIKLLCTACNTFRLGIGKNNRKLINDVAELERKGDSIRREIISNIYNGAFLPYLRPDLCRFVEIVDRVFDLIEDAAFLYLSIEIPEHANREENNASFFMGIPEPVKNECGRVTFLNVRICEMLLITFEAMLKGEDLSEKTLAIRIYEKKIDDIKFNILEEIRKIDIDNFWEGKILSDFIAAITRVSDIIEDASDHIQIISVSMR